MAPANQPGVPGTTSQPAPMVADHPALDLLNTVYKADGALVDSLQTDEDAAQWLARAGWPDAAARGLVPGPLRHTLCAFRELFRRLIVQRKAPKGIVHANDLAALNAMLKLSRSYLSLTPEPRGKLAMTRKWKRRSAEEAIAPLIESGTELLADGDFTLVRHCEDSECVLWFYDLTKSHHRRWCSMAACGNRNKVAAFRKRRQSAKA